MAAAMCSVEPCEPPPHSTLSGSFLSCTITSSMVLNGELGGSTKTLYSVVRRISGVPRIRLIGRLEAISPPTITAPITIIWVASPLSLARNGPMPSTPAAPGLFSKVTVAACLASSMAWPSARPVVSKPPPKLAGISTFRLAPGWAHAPGTAPAAASAARDRRKVARSIDGSPSG